MSASTPESRVVRFGVFELDLELRELRKAGLGLNLQEQPLQILECLLERPGRLVSRDELRKRLWPSDTLVDFEHGLNAAVKRLRDTLGDSADTPRFIETVPRRGYRFIARVEPSGEAGIGHPSQTSTGPAQQDPAAPGAAANQPSPGGRSWGTVSPASAGLMLILAAAAAAIVARRGGPDSGTASPPTSGSAYLLTQLTFDSGLTTYPTLSSDGQFLAYASDRAGADDLDIWIQRIDGTAAIRLTDDEANDDEPSFSPDGTRLVFRSDRDGGGIYVKPAHSGGRETMVAAGGHNPRFSPDGRFIVYWTGSGDRESCGAVAGLNRVFIVAADGGTPVPIAPQFPTACWPVWAPDSRRVLLTAQSKPDKEFGWFVVPIDGGPPVDTRSELIQRYKFAHLPQPEVWLGDRIVFSVFRHSPRNLWVTRIDRGTWKLSDVAEQVTTGTVNQSFASASAAGRLVFAAVSHKLQLWSLAIDGNRGRVRGGIQPLTEGLQYDRYPSVSVDGDALCFARYGFKGHAIYVMNARGGPETLRVPTSADVGLPVISADGSRIAYPRHAGEKGSIEVVRTSGGEAERVSSDCGLCVVEGWSHDNAHLSYIDGSNGRTEVFVLDLETGLKRVVATRSGHSLFQSRFSPDDRWLSFVAVVGNHSRVWIAPTPKGNRTADPATWIAVTTDDSWNDKPRWSPDGSIMYFISDRDGFRCVWAQRLDRRTRHPIDQPFAVYHIHSARRSMMNLLAANLGLDCADDRLVFNMGEDTGNIWTTRLEGAP